MCTRENTAYINPDGGRPIFGWEGVKRGLPIIKLPCGKCPECMKDYYTNWATRGSRELMRWERNVFITLTYRNECVPKDGSLRKKHVQDFIKRVKKHFRSTKENPIRQTYCGEYGTKDGRPHYHVVLYNCHFADQKLWRTTDQGNKVFRSETLEKLWPFGNSEFGEAEPGSIAYIYKYILKKKSRKEKKKPLKAYWHGKPVQIEHEFVESSRNPGIGAHMRGTNSVKKGYLTVDGVKKKLPKYYLEDLKKNHKNSYEQITQDRMDHALSKKPESELRKKQKENVQKRLTDTKKTF
ncbi:MAG: replication initiator protein [Arizlama microvirus]|nr:MAG: replication initiator protein [Arizlama microvirus]